MAFVVGLGGALLQPPVRLAHDAAGIAKLGPIRRGRRSLESMANPPTAAGPLSGSSSKTAVHVGGQRLRNGPAQPTLGLADDEMG